jgi:DNA-binding XRE family transcriptional regulator
MTQADLALAAGVSRRWIVDLEAGKPRAELALVLAVLDALGTPLTVETPDAPTVTGSSPGPTPGLDLDDHLMRLAGDD